MSKLRRGVGTHPHRGFETVTIAYDGSVEHHFNTGLLILNSEIKINEDSIYKENYFVLFDNVDGNIILESITEKSLVIVLSGDPINEPIITYGPFVMNTKEEIIQAYDDFDSGKFGTFNF